ncbi:MAG: UDP-N-acetylmuramate dehydrogenase [Armatimonadetes bacterium]|nr:UDP-N-acetylmuramate dehydrogenase [Armatimonadota bacterium]
MTAGFASTSSSEVRERLRAARLRAFLAQQMPDTEIRFDEPMSRHTSFRIGGPADALLLPRTLEDLQRCVRLSIEMGLPLTIVGNGSNLLVRDGGIRGLTLKIADNLARIDLNGVELTAQSGAPLAAVSRFAAEHSLTGLEFACGIPGALGGGVIMNAGAYGGELAEVTTQVRAVDERGGLRVLSAAEMQFGYRTSALQGKKWIVFDVTMRLQPGGRTQIEARMADFTCQRESKQPLSLPSAGSVFKRPPGGYVGPLVEQLGLKGYRIGDAQVSEKHAGFIVNLGAARAADVLALIQYVRGRVQERFGIGLETEVRVIGEDA